MSNNNNNNHLIHVVKANHTPISLRLHRGWTGTDHVTGDSQTCVVCGDVFMCVVMCCVVCVCMCLCVCECVVCCVCACVYVCECVVCVRVFMCVNVFMCV